MKKLTAADVTFVVTLLRSWRQGRLTWEGVRTKISSELLDGRDAWSRQSLQANKRIAGAWDAAKSRLAEPPARRTREGQASPSKAEELQADLDELQAKYDALFIRHRQLIYNASFLAGGTNLLLDPLPDNTPAPKRQAKRKKARQR